MLWWFLWGLKKQRTRGICHRSVFLSSNKQWQSNYWSYEQLSSSPERQSSYMCCAQPPARSPRTRLRQPLGNSLIGSTLLPCLQVRARSQFHDSWLGTGAPMSCAVTAGWLGERAHPAALHYPGVLQALRQPGAALASRPAVLFSLEFYFLPSDLLLLLLMNSHFLFGFNLLCLSWVCVKGEEKGRNAEPPLVYVIKQMSLLATAASSRKAVRVGPTQGQHSPPTSNPSQLLGVSFAIPQTQTEPIWTPLGRQF